MPRIDELELPRLDYTDPQLRGVRFHTALRELRAQSWLAAGPFGYVVLDREAGEFFLRTRAAIFPGLKIAEIFDVREGPLYEEMRRNILHVNGPDHTRLRSLVNPALSPRAVERYRPVMRELLAGLWDSHRGVECEFVEAFAKPYPSQAIAHFMGAPLADAPRLHHWSNWIQRQFDAVSMASERAGIEAAVAEFYEYAWALLRDRREQPREDLISALIAASAVDEAGGEVPRLSDVECVNLVLNVLVGGVDTTQSQLAHALRLFAEHPAQWELLAERPELAARAVEEVLRFEPIAPFTARIVVEELTFRDVVFPAETIVMVCAFTGNREGAGGDLDIFDIAAERGRARVLTFGAGVHYCVGANLARVELEEALAFLAPRMPRLELAGEPVYEAITGIYGLAELPLRFAAA
ncbi:MAG TPA: cytochrome P450 [Solirubrobacteraceae bacterium]|jgi:cytochrome P450|nr:cytochrome P450 [Solirubrobacteraceae bacterium]